MHWKIAVVLALVVFAIAQFVHVAHAPATVVEGFEGLLTGDGGQRWAFARAVFTSVVSMAVGAAVVGATFRPCPEAWRSLALRTLPLSLGMAVVFVDDVGQRAYWAALVVGATVFWATAGRGFRPRNADRLMQRGFPWLAAAVGVGLFAIAWRRHHGFWSSLIDLGLFYELFDNPAEQLLGAPTLGMSFLGEHFSPILVLLWPLMQVAPSPVTLLAVQAGCHALAAVLLAHLAWLRTGHVGLSTVLGFGFLVAPHNQQALLYDFHMDLFVPPLLFGAMIALFTQRTVVFWLCVVAMWCTKEDAFLQTTAIAAFAGVVLGRWRLAAWVTGLGLAQAAVLLGWLLPSLRAGRDPAAFSTAGASDGYAFLGRYDHLGGSIPEIAVTVLLEPLRVLRHLGDGPPFSSVVALLVGFGLLPLLARWGLLLLAPSLKILLGTTSLMSGFRFYYGAVALPFAALAAVEGAHHWLRQDQGIADAPRPETLPPDPLPSRAAPLGLALALGTMVLVLLHPASVLSPADQYMAFGRTPHHEEVAAALSEVPRGTEVVANGYLAVHLQRGRAVWMFPHGPAAPDVLVTDLQRPPWPTTHAHVRRILDTAAASGAYDVRHNTQRGLVLLSRRPADAAPAPATIAWWPFRYEAELSEHSAFRNRVQHAANASNGAYRSISEADGRGDGMLLYGPYIRAERGSYRATFFVRFQGHSHIESDAVVATLDVWAEGRTLATHELRQHEVDASTWTAVEVPFEVPSNLSKLETRVRFAGRGRLDVDAVEIGR